MGEHNDKTILNFLKRTFFFQDPQTTSVENSSVRRGAPLADRDVKSRPARSKPLPHFRLKYHFQPC